MCNVVKNLGRVSIVIPFFNAAATLGETIESALAQKDIELDVVAIDDGSTDESLAVARAFHPMVRVLCGPNCGVSAARNWGIDEAIGEWIVFLDADDLLLPGTLRTRLDVGEAAGADVVVCDWQEFQNLDELTKPGSVKSIDMCGLIANPEVAIATYVWATTAALMYRRSLVKKIGGFRHDLPVIQDARFFFDAAYQQAQFAYSPHIGARYRLQPNSLSRRDPARFWCDILSNGKQIERLWRARGPMSSEQYDALTGIYNNAARGLFTAEHPEYFAAVNCQRRLGRRLPLHPRLAEPLARVVGLNRAKRLLRAIGH
jgi:glycosyltransferase involved in cell wall biosynthesis